MRGEPSAGLRTPLGRNVLERYQSRCVIHAPTRRVGLDLKACGSDGRLSHEVPRVMPEDTRA
jgi:hypothetical protein